MQLTNWKYAALAAAALGAAACGGSDNDGGGQGTANLVSRGEIRDFGSVVVNGVRWRVAGATLRLDDDGTTRTLGSEAEIEQHLRRGQVVTVRGSLDDNGTGGQATEVRFGEDFQGAVTALTADGAGFTVLGVTVIVDASTTFSTSVAGAPAPTLASIAVGTRVEVSGFPDGGTNSFRATHVKTEDASGELEAKGFVVAPTTSGFQLALTPNGTPFLNVIAGSFGIPGLGAFVEVKATTVDNGTNPPTITLARAVELEDRFTGANGQRSEVEGIITGGGSIAEFVVGGTTVRTSGATTYTGIPDGSSAAEEFAVGVKVEAEGSFDAAGVLIANKVKFKDGTRVGGPITGLAGTATAPTFGMLGTLNVVSQAGTTRIDDGPVSSASFVEVRGYRRANGTIFAQRIRVRDGGGGSGRDPYVQGVVTSVANPRLTIMGIEITTGAGTEFQGEGEAPLSSTSFFDAIVLNRTVVKAKWNAPFTATTATAKEVEIEAEDD